MASKRKANTKVPVLKKLDLGSESELDFAEDITRCICLKTHTTGLMIQCEGCEVWQHCECIGLKKKNIPKKYWCERCTNPESQPSSTTLSRRTSSPLSVVSNSTLAQENTDVTVNTKTTPTTENTLKRRTMNSREAAQWEDTTLIGTIVEHENTEKEPNSELTLANDQEEPQKLETTTRKYKKRKRNKPAALNTLNLNESPGPPSSIDSDCKRLTNSKRFTIYEMKRRVKAMLEYMGSIDVNSIKLNSADLNSINPNSCNLNSIDTPNNKSSEVEESSSSSNSFQNNIPPNSQHKIKRNIFANNSNFTTAEKHEIFQMYTNLNKSLEKFQTKYLSRCKEMY